MAHDLEARARNEKTPIKRPAYNNCCHYKENRKPKQNINLTSDPLCLAPPAPTLVPLSVSRVVRFLPLQHGTVLHQMCASARFAFFRYERTEQTHVPPFFLKDAMNHELKLEITHSSPNVLFLFYVHLVSSFQIFIFPSLIHG